MKTGRPTRFTKYVAEEICIRLSEGESLYSICDDDHIPQRRTVYHWLSLPGYEEFLHQYTQARERQAETFIDQCVDIADDTAQDITVLTDKDGKDYEKVNHDHINRSRLKVDTRIKIAEKLAPKKYSAKHDVKISGDIKINVIDNFK